MTYEKNGAVRRNRSHGARDRQYYYKPAPENKGYGKKRTFLTSLLLISLAFLIAAAFVSFFTSYFNLKAIKVNGLMKHSEKMIIETSGIEMGKKLYGINSAEAEKRILEAYPEISEVSIKKVLPAEMIIELTYETPEYYICVTGEYFTLSETLRVIERFSEKKSLEAMGLIYLELPDIRRAVTGEKIEFFGEDKEYIGEILNSLSESGFAGEINRVYIDGKFDITLAKSGEFKIELGDFKDQSLKLLMAEKIMEAGSYRGQSGVVIDVSDACESSAMISKTLKID